ncbi:S-4TM family putative pore-forming effector [Phenylobacterium soli]|uniref:Uncharacterized protein n=1 Tax=Phenylobacterium soli TaxID=2170551 RepID=A0A328AJ74_9CAUL|nr:S-4TM family putative pore-forming effector [Phenylobacterium soli]RAK54902.1 hypothetical protein DJ017_10365 [Phenylobacterium soli]
MTNTIPQTQNSERALKFMRARQATYFQASVNQWLQLVVTVLAPVIGAMIGLNNPATRPYVALASVAASLLDAAVLDRAQRKLLATAAKMAEMFDVEVLQLPWNAFVVGPRLDAETIHGAAERYKGEAKMAKIRNWYPVVVGQAPLPLARIVCQRTNLWYDASLRRTYGGVIVIFAVAVTAGLVGAAIYLDLKFLDLVTTAIVPASPVLIWAIRERNRHKDTADAQERVKGESEALWDRAKAGGCSDDDCAERSREFQNSIYARRVSSPLILPFMYPLLRNRMEAQMNVGAEAMLRDAGLLKDKPEEGVPAG